MKTRWMVVVASVLTLVFAVPLRGQEPPALDRVEELSRAGRTQEARDVLAAWWEAESGKARRRDVQRGLWLRGRLTADPAQAAIDFRRLVIEYPGGPYSDQALFRLAQGAFAAGDSVAAAEHVARLAREYPTSPTRREAEAWLATAGPVPAPVAAAGDPAPGDAAAVEPVSAEPPSAPPTQPRPSQASPTADAPAEAREAPPTEASGSGDYTVQLGAFSSDARARLLLDRVAEAGFDGRLARVPGSDLVRVRVGRFDSAEGAGAILKRLQDLGFTAALARDAHREERVR